MRRRFGFTLAEVLITLAIIGVVAALTIPTLIVNYQQRGWNTSATLFERKLEESLKIMNTQGTLAGYKTTEEFVSELQKHLKITKVCKNDDILSCFEDKVMWGSGEADPEEVDMSTVKTSSNFGQSDWKTNVLGLQLANGTSALIAYNPECRQDPYSNQITGSSCVAVLYDTSGFTKPNTSGKDLRGINIVKLGNACALELNGKCYTTPFIPTPLTKAECESRKGDLGIKECYDNDYWAGAVAACGGVNKLTSYSDLEHIHNALISSDGLLDAEKVNQFGFNYKPYNGFPVWYSEEYDNPDEPGFSFVGNFAADCVYDEPIDRSSGSVQAVCVAN